MICCHKLLTTQGCKPPKQVEQSRRDEQLNKLTGGSLQQLEKEDPNGDTLVAAQKEYFARKAGSNG